MKKMMLIFSKEKKKVKSLFYIYWLVLFIFLKREERRFVK